MKSADDDWEELRLSTSAMCRSARDVSEGAKSSRLGQVSFLS